MHPLQQWQRQARMQASRQDGFEVVMVILEVVLRVVLVVLEVLPAALNELLQVVAVVLETVRLLSKAQTTQNPKG